MSKKPYVETDKKKTEPAVDVSTAGSVGTEEVKLPEVLAAELLDAESPTKVAGIELFTEAGERIDLGIDPGIVSGDITAGGEELSVTTEVKGPDGPIVVTVDVEDKAPEAGSDLITPSTGEVSVDPATLLSGEVIQQIPPLDGLDVEGTTSLTPPPEVIDKTSIEGEENKEPAITELSSVEQLAEKGELGAAPTATQDTLTDLTSLENQHVETSVAGVFTKNGDAVELIGVAGGGVEPEVTPTPPEPSVSQEEQVNLTPREQSRKDEAQIREEATIAYGKGEIGWPVEDCILFLESKVHPPKTIRQNWVRDVRRLLDVNRMTSSELEDFVDGLLEFPETFDTDLVWELVYRRYKVPGNATKEDVINYIKEQTPFPKTEDGVFLNDRVRASKPVTYWTYCELRAAMLGQIAHPFEKNVLLAAIKQSLGLSNTFSTSVIMGTLETERYSSMSVAMLTGNLEEYATARKKKSTPELQGAAHAGLLRIVKRILALEYASFKDAWTTLLDFVKREENTIFTDAKSFEHWSQVPLGKADVRALEGVVTLLRMTADPMVRNKGVNDKTISDLTTHLCTDDQRQKLFAYYSKK